LLRTAGSAVGDTCGRAASTLRCGFELDIDLATCARSQGGAAGVSLQEVSRVGAGDTDAADRQSCGAYILQSDGLRSASGANGYGTEVQAGRSELGGSAGPAQRHLLRAACGIVGDANRGAPSARRRWLELNLNRTTGPRLQRASAGGGFREVAAVGSGNGNGGNRQSGFARVLERDCLYWAGYTQGHGAKVQAGGR